MENLTFKDLSLEQMGALVWENLKKDDVIEVCGVEYQITKKTNTESRIKNLSSNKSGTILHTADRNIAWMKTKKDGVATAFFRNIESDILLSMLDENNILEPIKTECYTRATKQFDERNKKVGDFTS